MSVDFNLLPFESAKTMVHHRVSDQHIEFFEEPKLKLYRYGENNRPYLSCWFALGCEWFPEGKYLVFDQRVVINLDGGRLPFGTEKTLPFLAEKILEQYDSLLEFIQAIVDTKEVNGAELDFPLEEPVISEEWKALSEVSKGIVSMFYQSNTKEEFIGHCSIIEGGTEGVDLSLMYECLQHVRETELSYFACTTDKEVATSE